MILTTVITVGLICSVSFTGADIWANLQVGQRGDPKVCLWKRTMVLTPLAAWLSADCVVFSWHTLDKAAAVGSLWDWRRCVPGCRRQQPANQRSGMKPRLPHLRSHRGFVHLREDPRFWCSLRPDVMLCLNNPHLHVWECKAATSLT